MMPAPTAIEVWRDYETNGVPASGPHQVRKSDNRVWGTDVERRLAALAAGQGGLSDLPELIYIFSVTGGTPNHLEATPNATPPTAPGAALLTMTATAVNTGPVTLNGKPLRANGGEELQAGEVHVGDLLAFLDLGAEYRLITDPGSLRNKLAAMEWATNPEDEPVSFEAGGDGATTFSAKHWAAKGNEDADRSEVARVGSEAARDIAAGYAADAVSQGNVPIYATAVGMAALEVPAGINAVRVNGYYAAGDGEGGLAIDDDNGSPIWFASGGATSRNWFRASDGGQLASFSVIPSYGKTRSAVERFRDFPSVMDYDGVDETNTADSSVGLQRAFDNEQSIYMPVGGFKTTVPLIVRATGFTLIGADKVDAKIRPTHDGRVIEVGDTTPTTGNFASRTTLSNFYILGNGAQTGGIVLWDKEDHPGWGDGSKGCMLSNIKIDEISAGPGLEVYSWANLIQGIEMYTGNYRGMVFQKQAIANTILHSYITECAEEGLIVGDDTETDEVANNTFLGLVVQYCGGASNRGAIEVRGAEATIFHGLYTESNDDKGANYDVFVSSLAIGTQIIGVTNRGGTTGVVRDEGLDTKVSGIRLHGNADCIVRRSGSVVTGDYSDLSVIDGVLTNGKIRDTSTGAAIGRYRFLDEGVSDSKAITTNGGHSSTGAKNGKTIDSSLIHSSRNSSGASTHAAFYNPNGQVGSIVTNGQFTEYRTSANIRWLSGVGDPNGSVVAPVGSLYTRSDGGASTTLYVKQSGTDSTGWVAK